MAVGQVSCINNSLVTTVTLTQPTNMMFPARRDIVLRSRQNDKSSVSFSGSVDQRSFAVDITIQAATGLCMPISQTFAKHNSFIAAFAPAEPHRSSVLVVVCTLKNCKSSKCQPGQINRFRHFFSPLCNNVAGRRSGVLYLSIKVRSYLHPFPDVCRFASPVAWLATPFLDDR